MLPQSKFLWIRYKTLQNDKLSLLLVEPHKHTKIQDIACSINLIKLLKKHKNESIVNDKQHPNEKLKNRKWLLMTYKLYFVFIEITFIYLLER